MKMEIFNGKIEHIFDLDVPEVSVTKNGISQFSIAIPIQKIPSTSREKVIKKRAIEAAFGRIKVANHELISQAEQIRKMVDSDGNEVIEITFTSVIELLRRRVIVSGLTMSQPLDFPSIGYGLSLNNLVNETEEQEGKEGDILEENFAVSFALETKGENFLRVRQPKTGGKLYTRKGFIQQAHGMYTELYKEPGVPLMRFPGISQRKNMMKYPVPGESFSTIINEFLENQGASIKTSLIEKGSNIKSWNPRATPGMSVPVDVSRSGKLVIEFVEGKKPAGSVSINTKDPIRINNRMNYNAFQDANKFAELIQQNFGSFQNIMQNFRENYVQLDEFEQTFGHGIYAMGGSFQKPADFPEITNTEGGSENYIRNLPIDGAKVALVTQEEIEKMYNYISYKKPSDEKLQVFENLAIGDKKRLYEIMTKALGFVSGTKTTIVQKIEPFTIGQMGVAWINDKGHFVQLEGVKISHRETGEYQITQNWTSDFTLFFDEAFERRIAQKKTGSASSLVIWK